MKRAWHVAEFVQSCGMERDPHGGQATNCRRGVGTWETDNKPTKVLCDKEWISFFRSGSASEAASVSNLADRKPLSRAQVGCMGSVFYRISTSSCA